nr:replication factor A protein 1-like [Ipomoea batatas]
MRSIASFSSLSYSNNFEESSSHTLDLVTITELYTRDKRSRPPKQILDLVNRCMLFRISAKTEHLSKPDSAFPVFKVNTDQQLLKQHCPEILGIPEEEVNTEMLSLEDDEILEGFQSDEADSPIATLPPLSGEAAEGSVKRSLIDEFSSTQGCRKVKQHRVKCEKID